MSDAPMAEDATWHVRAPLTDDEWEKMKQSERTPLSFTIANSAEAVAVAEPRAPLSYAEWESLKQTKHAPLVFTLGGC
jgi:hypothetical protein